VGGTGGEDLVALPVGRWPRGPCSVVGKGKDALLVRAGRWDTGLSLAFPACEEEYPGTPPHVALAAVAGLLPGDTAKHALEHWEVCGECDSCGRTIEAARQFCEEYGLLGIAPGIWPKHLKDGDEPGLPPELPDGADAVERVTDFVRAAALLASWLECYADARDRVEFSEFLRKGPPVPMFHALYFVSRVWFKPLAAPVPTAPGYPAAEKWLRYVERYLPHPGLSPVLAGVGIFAHPLLSQVEPPKDDSPIFAPVLHVPTLWQGLHVTLLLDLWGGRSLPARCAREDCRRLFLREPARERGVPRMYCSRACGDVVRHRRARAGTGGTPLRTDAQE
jgi:hypothetical protein